MRRVLAALFVLVLTLALTVPALAEEDTTTTVNMVTDGTERPLIKCKWETPDDGDKYWDPDPALCYKDAHGNDAWEEGTQVAAVAGTYDPSTGETSTGERAVQYWAVVAPDSTYQIPVNMVWADVYHPNVQKRDNVTGLVDSLGEWCGSEKYELPMPIYEPYNNDAQAAAFLAAYEDHLVTFNMNWVNDTFGGDINLAVDDVLHEISQGAAEVYMEEGPLHNHQPAGDYIVDIHANNNDGNEADPVIRNIMTFVELDSFLIDFTTVDYGDVLMNYDKRVNGDNNLTTTNMPTVWNNGNTYLNMTVKQDDAGFGQRGVDPALWNVHWGARLGSETDGTRVNYDPCAFVADTEGFEAATPVLMPGLLVMCTPTKIDFWILVDKAPAGPVGYAGNMTLGCEHVDFICCG